MHRIACNIAVFRYAISSKKGKDEAYEVTIFETTADIIHDGIEDLVSVVGYSAV